MNIKCFFRKKIRIFAIILLAFSCQCNLLAMIKDVNKELVSAIKEGSIERVANCIERGANVNFVTHNGNTPLMYAARGLEPSEGIVSILIHNGANVDYYRRVSGSRSFHTTPLIFAVKNTNINIGIIKLLIGNGTDVDHVAIFNGASETALICAILFGRSFDIIELIINNSLDVDFVNSRGKKAIDYVEGLCEGKRRTALMNLFR